MRTTTAETVKIGQIAKSCNLPVSTIRYYLNKGLIKEEYRTPGGVRLFDREKTVQKVKKIRGSSKKLTLEQLKEIV
ncbi:MAG: MerR family DNA-binding transcriptional regulator [Elusimicrobiota bacterium]